jgi:hypothetical protein
LKKDSVPSKTVRRLLDGFVEEIAGTSVEITDLEEKTQAARGVISELERQIGVVAQYVSRHEEGAALKHSQGHQSQAPRVEGPKRRHQLAPCVPKEQSGEDRDARGDSICSPFMKR